MAVLEDPGGNAGSGLLSGSRSPRPVGGDVDLIVAALIAGQLAILPTETVYGLGADARQPAAVRRLFRVKGRPATHPVIVHVGSPAAIADWSADLPEAARRLTEALWPGPLTIVVPAADSVDRGLTGGQDTIALRCPAQPLFLDVLARMSNLQGAAAAVAAPSANRFGQVSPTSAARAVEALGPRLSPQDVVADGGPCEIGLESTVVDCTSTPVRILRPGRIGPRQLADVIGPDEVGASRPAPEPAGSRLSDGVRVPGSLASHYAPATLVRVVDVTALDDRVDPERTNVGLIAPDPIPTPPNLRRIGAPRDTVEFARQLYAWFRLADELSCRELLVVLPPEAGDDPLATAIADRVGRAAHPTTT